MCHPLRMTTTTCTDGTVQWLTDADTSLLDTPNEDGLTERAYWHVSVNADGTVSLPYFEAPEELPEYDPFERDQTYKED